LYWNLAILIPLIAMIFYGVLLFIAIRQDLRRAANSFFVFYLLSVFVWTLGSFLIRVDPENAALWQKVMLSGAVAMPVALFGFVQAFLGVEGQVKWLYVGFVSSVVLLVLNVLGYLSSGVYVAEGGLIQYQFGPAVPLLALEFVFFVALSVLNLWQEFGQTRDPMQRSRIRLVGLGIGVVVLGSLTNLIDAWGSYPIDIAAHVVNALLLGYAIFSYQLLDITIVVRRGFLYSAITAFIGASYFVVVLVAMELARQVPTQQVLLISLIVAVVTAVAIRPWWNQAQSWVDRLFFHEKYEANLMLQRLSRAVATAGDLSRMIETILDEIVTTMHVAKVALLLKSDESGDFVLMAQRGHDGNGGVELGKDHPLVDWLSYHQDALTKQQVAVMPQYREVWAQVQDSLGRMHAQLFIPLLVREELIGILLLGPKSSEAAYSVDEQLALSTLANQASVAVQNAWLHQQAIEERETMMETIVEEAFAGIMVVDQRMRLVTVNPGVEAITGYAADELLGKQLPEIFDPELWGEGSLLSKVMATGVRVEPAEATLAGKRGARDVLLGVTPMREGYLLNFADITRLKEVDRLKSSIVANVSHELRAPLASIKAYTELLLDNLEGEDRVLRHRFLTVIDQESDWLAELINDLLDLSRLESERFTAQMDLLSMNEVIDGVMSLLDLQVRKRGITIHPVISPELPPIVADKELMTILVKNLVSNAVKFSPEGGLVDVEVRAVGDNLVLDVVDKGIGIPPEDLPHVFTKFYRSGLAKEYGIRGTGLGLALAKDAADIHDGIIEVESELGVGSRFTVTLPVNRKVGSMGSGWGE
jgi:PAS domain S-box-containing protein